MLILTDLLEYNLQSVVDASVEKGKELLLNYGEGYWLEEHSSSDEEDPGL